MRIEREDTFEIFERPSIEDNHRGLRIIGRSTCMFHEGFASQGKCG
jgi:hypothetical protein